jgi:hypothetical protein
VVTTRLCDKLGGTLSSSRDADCGCSGEMACLATFEVELAGLEPATSWVR